MKRNTTAGAGSANKSDGFTLVELLVIIAVIALVAVMQVSALASAKGRTKVAQCASNLQQVTLALHLYGGENNDKLPVYPASAGFWAWDLPWNVGETLLSYNLEKRNFYCPGTAPRFTDADNNTLWNFFPNQIHVTGYLFAFSGSSSLIIVSNQNTTLLTERIRLTGSATGPTLPAPPNAERVLTADATISSPGGGVYLQRYSYNYTDVAGGFSKAHTSPHLNGRFPAGGNVGFKDGHVGWRNFDDMNQRASPSGPSFWW